MHLDYLKATLAVTALCGIGLAGNIAGNVTLVSSWSVLAAAAAVPLAMMQYWTRPGQSMSQSIQEVLR
jgi:hypothetical protein